MATIDPGPCPTPCDCEYSKWLLKRLDLLNRRIRLVASHARYASFHADEALMEKPLKTDD